MRGDVAIRARPRRRGGMVAIRIAPRRCQVVRVRAHAQPRARDRLAESGDGPHNQSDAIEHLRRRLQGGGDAASRPTHMAAGLLRSDHSRRTRVGGGLELHRSKSRNMGGGPRKSGPHAMGETSLAPTVAPFTAGETSLAPTTESTAGETSL